MKNEMAGQRLHCAVGGKSDGLPAIVYPEGLAAIVADAAWKRTQVVQHTFLPFECVLNEAVWAVEAIRINSRRIRSARNRPVAAQEVIGWASKIETYVWPAERSYIDEIVFVMLGRMFLRGQQNWDG